ncbi:MAG: plastocyanin/azurin family copper-binding protein [Parvularcula sp.]
MDSVIIGRRGLLMGLAGFWVASDSLANPDGRQSAQIHMYSVDAANPDRSMVFSPRIVRAKQGCTVEFIPNDPDHNTQSTPGMLPNGAKSWNSPFGRPFSIRLDTPGFYGYHCLAHRSMGMVGLIIVEGVGMEKNRTSAKGVSHPGRAAAVWEEIWAEAEKGER